MALPRLFGFDWRWLSRLNPPPKLNPKSLTRYFVSLYWAAVARRPGVGALLPTGAAWAMAYGEIGAPFFSRARSFPRRVQNTFERAPAAGAGGVA